MNIKGLFAFAVVVLTGVLNVEAEEKVAVVNPSSTFLNVLNTKRLAMGHAAVCYNSKLTSAAQWLADDNAKNDKVKTTGSDGSNATTRYKAVSMQPTKSAELVAGGQNSVETVLEAWNNGPSSNLFEDFQLIGLGYTFNATSTYKHYWVLDLASADNEFCDTV
ncbi:hypothetical protein KXD40_001098 [Peronospora effusa]|uniref:SCP domain-containing protein n=1 Tax=Peronospora effusa TaxID=542832 RepID=A0A3M6VCK4_9STRA|nr:hypothetical protein DD238_006346 [Peronospora effusa]RQM13031.1 hypothetical protein DD237_006714 [Peronospora effusa]UIZ21034.1 hypothetical protein KXD40_001098 [Peronospora effusa]CAI5723893.1 unnamed protein product [Peronospora effusa]